MADTQDRVSLVEAFYRVYSDILAFAEIASGLKLRAYQKAVAAAVAESVIHKRGLTFVVIFPRQSGKNELQAQIETYLLALFQERDAEIVKASPTWKPQSMNAMRRLERILKRNLISRGRWSKESGYIFLFGSARMFFLSGAPSANVVGATASTLLECDEAQDVSIEKWDKEIAPMAASTNATRVFWGTAWTSRTLLAREKRAALKAQEGDGIQRVFELSADEVRKEVPAYGKHVDAEIAKHGRNHPFIRTQYFSEEIDEQSGMFPVERQAMMQGAHAPQATPKAGAVYAFCIDVGGEALTLSPSPNDGRGEALTPGPSPNDGRGESREHDSTALTIVEVELSQLSDPLCPGPAFHVVHRRAWTGVGQIRLYQEISALAAFWCPHRMIVDATGVGEGLAGFLDHRWSGQVIRFKFTAQSKSDLGWKFLTLVETGRYKEFAPQAAAQAAGVSDPGYSGEQRLQAEFWRQCRFMQMEVLPGPGKLMRWSVPDGTRDPATGERVHDDLVLSAALCAALYQDGDFGVAKSEVIEAPDPLKSLAF